LKNLLVQTKFDWSWARKTGAHHEDSLYLFCSFLSDIQYGRCEWEYLPISGNMNKIFFLKYNGVFWTVTKQEFFITWTSKKFAHYVQIHIRTTTTTPTLTQYGLQSHNEVFEYFFILEINRTIWNMVWYVTLFLFTSLP
jgi:hypothetical protein